jgi:hypothetical protein
MEDMTLEEVQQNKRRKKTVRKYLIEKLDSIVSEYIRLRDGKCVVCNSKDDLTNGHLFSRGSYSLRWDIRSDGNCHCQCLICNFKHEYDAYPYTNWYIKKFGMDRYDELHREYMQITKFTDSDLVDIYNQAEQEIKKLKDRPQKESSFSFD